MSQFIEMFGDPSVDTKWPTKKLKELGSLDRGVSKARPRNTPELLGGPYPLIQTGDITEAKLFIKDYHQTYSELGLAQSKMWKRGTLCITIAANIAQTAILDIDACFPDSVVGFIPYEVETIFIHYWFSFIQQVLERQAPQTAQKNINLKILSELDVIVPPKELQSKFVNIVLQADKSEFVGFKSQFIEEFGTMDSPKWETKTLPEISQNMDSKRIPIRSGNRKQGKYPYYGASGIVDYVDDYIFDEKILLVSEDGANLKERVAPIAFSSEGKVWVNNHAHVLRFNDYSLQKFVEYYLNYNKIDRYLTGTAQPKLNQDKLNNIPIPFPPEKQLRRFDCLTQQADKSEKCCEFRLAS